MSGTGTQALSAFLSRGVEANEAFREMIEALPIALYGTDAEGRLTFFNPAAVRLSGRVPDLGTDRWCVTWKLYLADGTPLPHEQCPMAIALRGGEVATGIECIAERPDGSRFWFTPYPAILRDAQGRVTGGINLLVDITERKLAEAEVQRYFEAIVETTPECVKVVARDGTLQLMNSAGLAMVGANAADEVLGRSVYDLIAPEYRERFREFHERICAGERGSLEFEIAGLKGTRRRVDTHAAPLVQSDGTTIQLAVTRDITERNQAERAGLLLQAIVDSSDDAIVSKDLNGIVTSWNKGAERIFGYTAEEAVGQSITIIIPPDRLDEEPKILARLRRGQRVDHFETIRRRKDGTLLNISLTISPVKDPKGKIIGASKIARDITDRKRAEAALIASEAKFRQLADSMPQIVWTARPDGYLDYYNERWYEYTGFSRDSFGDASWQPVIHPDDRQRCRDAWYQTIGSGKPYEIEHRFWDRRSNRWRWFMGRALPVREAEGRIVKWFGSFTDIDDQKRVEEELRRANQDLEQFAFSASHDLQEPLRTVKIYSELLVQTLGGKVEGDTEEFLRYLQSGATRLELLVRDLLTYTQASTFEPPTRTIDAGAVLKTTLASLAGRISETSAEIVSGTLPAVRVHEAHLQQLFQNLLSNAMKYRSPERVPAIKVTAEPRGEQWVFAVSDNGIGINPEYKERIFGLFKRLHSNEEYSGTGIGLALCRRIVDRYNGRIWAESRPGQGSTFSFTLPG